MGLEAKVAELTAQQIDDLMVEYTFKLLLSASISTIGFAFGLRAKEDIARYAGLILGALGALGTLSYILSLLELTTLIPTA